MKNIELFGQNLNVRDYICSNRQDLTLTASPSLTLYIKITDSCNANCLFALMNVLKILVTLILKNWNMLLDIYYSKIYYME